MASQDASRCISLCREVGLVGCIRTGDAAAAWQSGSGVISKALEIRGVGRTVNARRRFFRSGVKSPA